MLFDDVGFSGFGSYGSSIRTPNIDRLASHGVRYTSFHTTTRCSTTRAALLTGRNHHATGVGSLANFDSGFPRYRGKLSPQTGTLAEMLRLHGWCNYNTLIADGDATSGYRMYMDDDYLIHDLNVGGEHQILRSHQRIVAGRHKLGYNMHAGPLQQTPPRILFITPHRSMLSSVPRLW